MLWFRRKVSPHNSDFMTLYAKNKNFCSIYGVSIITLMPSRIKYSNQPLMGIGSALCCCVKRRWHLRLKVQNLSHCGSVSIEFGWWHSIWMSSAKVDHNSHMPVDGSIGCNAIQTTINLQHSTMIFTDIFLACQVLINQVGTMLQLSKEKGNI